MLRTVCAQTHACKQCVQQHNSHQIAAASRMQSVGPVEEKQIQTWIGETLQYDAQVKHYTT